MEWYKEKQLANVIYQLWAPLMTAREKGAFSSNEEWDRELGKGMIVAKGEMENVLGRKFHWRNLQSASVPYGEHKAHYCDGHMSFACFGASA